MKTDAFTAELERNRRAYEALRDEIRRLHSGKYVVLAFGRVITVCPSFDEAMAAVRGLTPAPEHVVVFPANEEPIFEGPTETYQEFVE